MDRELFRILERFRPCFSRQATYYWFLIVMIGLVVRGDHFGVSSFIRCLSLSPDYYYNILRFFESNAWDLQTILVCWWDFCLTHQACLEVEERLVFLGDHTNQPKDGRRMPGVVTIHQNSETSSKPSYFRGHVWAFLALAMEKAGRRFAVPLWGELNLEPRNETHGLNSATRIVHQAIATAQRLDRCAYLVLDAFFAIGPVFLLAAANLCCANEATPWVHIITRAKKNAVGYEDPEPRPPGKRGKDPTYGKKRKLMGLFEQKASEFVEHTCLVYGHTETVKLLCLDLLWKPIQRKIRFVLAITSRGPIVLMSSDLTLAPEKILELYCRRASIETMFSALKHLVGGLAYHFWSKSIAKSSRRPKSNKLAKATGPIAPAEVVDRKVRSIELFVNLSAIALGILQILALHFPQQIWAKNTRWLRTYSNNVPSEYIVKGVLTQTILMNLRKVNAHSIYTLIRTRQSEPDDIQQFEQAA